MEYIYHCLWALQVSRVPLQLKSHHFYLSYSLNASLDIKWKFGRHSLTILWLENLQNRNRLQEFYMLMIHKNQNLWNNCKALRWISNIFFQFQVSLQNIKKSFTDKFVKSSRGYVLYPFMSTLQYTQSRKTPLNNSKNCLYFINQSINHSIV